MKRNTFRDGRVHVCAEKCETCIFMPGNLMNLKQGRVGGLVAAAKRDDTAIICHSTIGGLEAVCRGFYDKHQTTPLKVAARLGLIAFQPVSKQK